MVVGAEVQEGAGVMPMKVVRQVMGLPADADPMIKRLSASPSAPRTDTNPKSRTPMAHVITRSCCSDASCLAVCPVNCIHPTPDEPDLGTTEMLYIDPAGCVDCGACVAACPAGAITPEQNSPPSSSPTATSTRSGSTRPVAPTTAVTRCR